MKLNEILPKEYQRFNESNIETLKQIMKSNSKVTWVLGAGMSAPAGLPMWNALLAKMWAILIDIDLVDIHSSMKPITKSYMDAKDEILSRIDIANKANIDIYKEEYQDRKNKALLENKKSIFASGNTLEMAEYIQNYIMDIISSQKYLDKPEEVANSFLKSVLKRALKVGPDGLREISKKTALKEVAKILAYRKNTSAITYNYDTLLEMLLEKQINRSNNDLDRKRSMKVLDCNNYKASYTSNDVIVCHPHGLLNVANVKSLEDSRDIILTESSYYKMESTIYNWINSVQAAALHESSCVFAGFSGEDYNFRRIIKNLEDGIDIKNNMHPHFIFYVIDNMVWQAYEIIDKKGRVVQGKEEACAIQTLKDLKNSYEYVQFITKIYAQYSYWSTRGITTIWTTKNELPRMIANLYSDTK